MDCAEDVLAFWLDEVGSKGWYAVDPALDAQISARFSGLWDRGRTGDLDHWRAKPRSCLALVILLDQFPRNMFRDDPRAFSSDAAALSIAKAAIHSGFDLRVSEASREFFYLPLMHSEIVSDQERAVRLFKLHVASPSNLTHARAHRAVIRRFGRFPYRNTALRRVTTAAEADWLAVGGYRMALQEVS